MSIGSIIQENLVIITGVVSSAATALFGWLATRKKDEVEGMRTEFSLLMASNASFREEVRKDLEVAKLELAAAKVRITSLEGEVRLKTERIFQLENTLAQLQQ